MGSCPARKVGAIRSGSVYGVLWGYGSGCEYLSRDAAIQGAARLVAAPGAMVPAVCQHFGADRLGVVFCSSDRVTVSGILGGVLGLSVHRLRILGVWRVLLLTF